MPDWNFEPVYPQKVPPERQPTLVTPFEDLTEHRRSKGSAKRETFEETYYWTEADVASAEAFYDTYEMVTPFTKLSYRPGAGDGHEVTVRFAGPIEREYVGPDEYHARVEFVELVGE